MFLTDSSTYMGRRSSHASEETSEDVTSTMRLCAFCPLPPALPEGRSNKYIKLQNITDGYSKDRMLSILKDRATYLMKRGGTLNNPHIPGSYFHEILKNTCLTQPTGFFWRRYCKSAADIFLS